jgi:murein tripeptide amidase MpaA
VTGYLRAAGVTARLDTAVSLHRAIATRGTWSASHGGRSPGYVKIGATTAASPPARWSALVTGGVHARELAPPDALLSFVERLLAAYDAGADVSYPAFRSADGVTFDAFTVPFTEVQSIVERVNLVVAPLVNPDGRDFVLAPLGPTDDPALHKMWRKNLRDNDGDGQITAADGVDLNRNFDILFEFAKHYDVAVADVHTSNDRSDDSYCGPTAGSEPETGNLVKLFKDEKVSYYLDVHSFSRSILYSWGIEANQSVDATMSFTNPVWDHKRDGVKHNAYSEYIPATQEAAAAALATQMCTDIAARAGGSDAVAVRRSTYQAKPSGAGLYVTTGAVDDFCFSRWFTAAKAGRPIPPVVALTMESGGDPRKGADAQDGEFWPDFTTQFPKIEREIHCAVWSFLTQVAATPVSGPSAPPSPPPAPTTTSPPPPKKSCLVATTLYRDPGHPSVVFLRDVRDRQLPASGPGRWFSERLVAGYAQAAPPLARWLTGHPAAARATRVVVFDPFVRALQALSAATARRPLTRSLLLSVVVGAVAGPVIAVVRAVEGGRRSLPVSRLGGPWPRSWGSGQPTRILRAVPSEREGSDPHVRVPPAHPRGPHRP